MTTELRVITNLPDVRAQFRGFSADFERRVIRSATNAAAQVIKRLAVQNAPVLSEPRKDRAPGTLRRGIYVVRNRRAGKGRELYSIGARSGRKSVCP